PRARLAVLTELKVQSHKRETFLIRRHSGNPLSFSNRDGQFAAVKFGEQGFVVKTFQLRRCSVLEKVDNTLGLRREMRHTGDRLNIRFATFSEQFWNQ